MNIWVYRGVPYSTRAEAAYAASLDGLEWPAIVQVSVSERSGPRVLGSSRPNVPDNPNSPCPRISGVYGTGGGRVRRSSDCSAEVSP